MCACEGVCVHPNQPALDGWEFQSVRRIPHPGSHIDKLNRLQSSHKVAIPGIALAEGETK